MLNDKKTVIEHIIEFRKRLIVILLFFTIFSVLGFIFSSKLLFYLRDELFLKDFGIYLIVSHPLDYLLAKINIAIFIGILFSIPIIIYQLYLFMKPGLLEREKRILTYSIFFGSILFILGMLFGYFFVLKFTIWFLATLTKNTDILNLWNLNAFISFAFFLCISMGFAFLTPIFVTILVKFEIVDIRLLRDIRPYTIITIFILSAIVTPPDPFSQLIMAIPLIILYEVGVIIAGIVSKV